MPDFSGAGSLRKRIQPENSTRTPPAENRGGKITQGPMELTLASRGDLPQTRKRKRRAPAALQSTKEPMPKSTPDGEKKTRQGRRSCGPRHKKVMLYTEKVHLIKLIKSLEPLKIIAPLGTAKRRRERAGRSQNRRPHGRESAEKEGGDSRAWGKNC